MNERVIELTKGLSKNDGASEGALVSFMVAVGIQLPEQYLEFMRKSNGGEGYIGGNSYLALFPIEQLLQINDAAAVKEFAPGILIFGSDGVGTSYAFNTRANELPIVECYDIDLSFEAATPCGSTFVEFLEYLLNKANDK